MPHLAVVSLEHLQECALQGGMHAKIGFLQEKQAAWFWFCFSYDRVGADDQALHAIAEIVNGSFIVIPNPDVNHIVFALLDRYQGYALPGKRIQTRIIHNRVQFFSPLVCEPVNAYAGWRIGLGQ